MLMCYVDESGDTGALVPSERNTQPVFLISAVIVKQPSLKHLTRAIIDLKKRFFPAYGNGLTHWHDWLKVEVKGANLRRSLREGTHDAKRHVIGFMEQLLRLMEQHHVQIVSRIYLKEANAAFNGSSVYPAAIQRLSMAFEDKLQRENEQGIFILDSRNKVKNVPVAHGIFTMNFSAHGTSYDHLAELPLFGHSENHAMLQLADWIGSAFLCPMAVRAYYTHLENVCVHADAIFDLVRNRFGQRIKALQYRYERDGHKLGGVSVLAGGNRKVSPVLVFGAKSPLPPS